MRKETLSKYLYEKIDDARRYIHLIDVQGKERERSIYIYRLGIEDGECKTLEETGKRFGVTRERIRQIEAKVGERIRQYKNENNLL